MLVLGVKKQGSTILCKEPNGTITKIYLQYSNKRQQWNNTGWSLKTVNSHGDETNAMLSNTKNEKCTQFNVLPSHEKDNFFLIVTYDYKLKIMFNFDKDIKIRRRESFKYEDEYLDFMNN